VVSMSAARLTLHDVAQWYFHIVARVIACVFPRQFWYRALLQICRVQQYAIRPFLGFTRYRKDSRRSIILSWLVESTLRHLVQLGRPFPIQLHHKNLGLILDARSTPNGLVLCSVHLPFSMLSLTQLVEAGVLPTAVVAHPTAMLIKGGRLSVWNTTQDLPGLVADRDVLCKMRTILRRGGFVVTLIDNNLGALNTNVFRLIRSTGARVLFMVFELQPDGSILIEYLSPPDPFCLSNESVVSNLLFFQERTDRITRSLNRFLIHPERMTPQAEVATVEVDSTP